MVIRIIAIAVAACVLSSCASKKDRDRNAPTGKPTGSIVLSGKSAAYMASTQRGSGTLIFNGMRYPFSAKTVGVGGVGIQSIEVEGDVYELKSLSDFPGTYNMVATGATILKGKKNVRLTNEKGVIVYGKNKSKGIGVSTGVSKVEVTLQGAGIPIKAP